MSGEFASTGAVPQGRLRLPRMAGGGVRPLAAWRWAFAACLIYALVAAGLARFLFGYPWYAQDELYWAQIISARAQGVYYPISGAVFVWLNELIIAAFDWPSHVAISVFGWFSVAPALATTYWVYRRWQGERAVLILITLLSTAYFWAPLIESKPQQWGQPMALLGVFAFFACVRGNLPWWVLAACATALAFVHNLSFAVLAACCLWAWLACLALGWSTFAHGMRTLLALLPGVLLIAWPDGPYSVTVKAVWIDHIHNHFAVMMIVGTGAVAALAFALVARKLVSGLRDTSEGPREWLAQLLSLRALALFGLLIAICLGFQALLLPDTYWQMYGNSLLRFLFAQSGNLLFLLVSLSGTWLAMRHALQGTLPRALQEALVMLAGCALMGLAGLGVTVWMLDNNWFLRIASYTALFAAPLAAYGLGDSVSALSKRWWLALIVAAILSSLLAIRWCGLVSC